MKAWIVLIAIVVGITVAGYFIDRTTSSPEYVAWDKNRAAMVERNTLAADQREKKEEWRDRNIALAESQVTNVLFDPDSVKFRNVNVIAPAVFDPSKTGVVCGFFNAKNRFGGYAGFQAFMVIDSQPMIKQDSVAFHRLWNRECLGKTPI